MGVRRLIVAALVVIARPLGAATPASAQTTRVATLTGETLIACHAGSIGSFTVGCAFGEFQETGPDSFRMRGRCEPGGGTGTVSWTARGLASGPYADTFTESGVATFAGGVVTSLVVTFHIDSELADVDGRKFIVAPTGFGGCASGGRGGFLMEVFGVFRYEAIIKPVTGGSFADEGLVDTTVGGVTATNPTGGEAEATIGSLDETFTSTLSEARPLLPDAKEQCKDQGFLIFGVFENQGDCVSFVSTHGKNEPGKNIPSRA